MHPLVKLVLGIVLGLVLSFFVITLFEGWMSHSYPMNVKNPGNQEYLDAMKTMPVNAFLILIAGYMVSSFFGGYVAARISPEPYKIYASATVGFLLLLGGLMIFITIPHPLWVAATSCISYMLFALLAGKIAKR
jgi:hypothetical protein